MNNKLNTAITQHRSGFDLVVVSYEWENDTLFDSYFLHVLDHKEMFKEEAESLC